MRQKPAGRQPSSEQIIWDIKSKIRKQYSAEEKIRIVLDGLRDEDSAPPLADTVRLPFFSPRYSATSLYRGANPPPTPSTSSSVRKLLEFPNFRWLQTKVMLFPAMKFGVSNARFVGNFWHRSAQFLLLHWCLHLLHRVPHALNFQTSFLDSSLSEFVYSVDLISSGPALCVT